MYQFENLDLLSVDNTEFQNYKNKNLFTTIDWLCFLSEWKNVNPIILRVTNESNQLVAHFTGCIFYKYGIKILGSPFWGWMGQHMGFDFVDIANVDKSLLLDEITEYIRIQLKVKFFVFADFQYEEDDIKQCKTQFFADNIRGSYFLDLTQPEENLFKNFKSGYRTCVRKFEKLGGTIEEEYSQDFMEEHHKQLKDVFERKSMTPPNYKQRLNLLHEKNPNMILSIKALDDKGNNIASSYYLAAGSMAFFQSNASYTDALKYNANQALMWYAIKYFKSNGYKTLDLAGRASYKENFGPILKSTPTVVWTKYRWLYQIVISLRNIYYSTFRVAFKIKSFFKK